MDNQVHIMTIKKIIYENINDNLNINNKLIYSEYKIIFNI